MNYYKNYNNQKNILFYDDCEDYSDDIYNLTESYIEWDSNLTPEEIGIMKGYLSA